MTEVGQTAVIVPVPAAEPAVGRWRERCDPAAVLGVAAHVTVLFPFAPAATVYETLLARLSEVVAQAEPFDCTLAGCWWFGEDVLWLAPDPDQPFRDLTAALVEAFPQYPPYGNAFDDVVPHLTIGESRRATPEELREAETAVRVRLPITARIDCALLMAGIDAPGSWRTVAELPFAAAHSELVTRGGAPI